MKIILQVKDLTVTYHDRKYEKVLVDGVSFNVQEGQCIGILGESGSGKSMTCKAFMGLLGERHFKISGSVKFNGKELLGMKENALRELRGKKICMILQNPMTCFDPLYRIGEQMKETLKENTSLSGEQIRDKCIETLKRVHIKKPEEVMYKYPHQLSGGMLQRVMIGLALVSEPDLIIADEPTTAIDSITQYEIIQEFQEIKSQTGTAMIFISHDLGVISKVADDVIVMYQSQVVQKGALKEVYQNPVDGYTQELIGNRLAVVRQFEKALQIGGGTT